MQTLNTIFWSSEEYAKIERRLAVKTTVKGLELVRKAKDP